MANLNIQTNTELWSVGGFFQMAELDANDCPICFRNVGIVEDVTITPNVTTIECRDELGNIFEECVTETEVTMSMNFKSFNRRNLARVLFGNESIVAAQTGKTKTFFACHGGILPLGGIDATNISVVNVTQANVAMIEGENYTVSCGSITVLDEAAQIAAGAATVSAQGATDELSDQWLVTWDLGEQACVEAFTRNTVQVGIFFEGINRCNESNVFVEIFKASINPATFNFLATDAFGSLAVNATLQTTNCPEVVTAGGSRLYRQCYESA